MHRKDAHYPLPKPTLAFAYIKLNWFYLGLETTCNTYPLIFDLKKLRISEISLALKIKTCIYPILKRHYQNKQVD